MSASMPEEFLGEGIVTIEQLKKRLKKPAERRPNDFESLENAPSVSSFKRIARNLLLKNSGAIHAIIVLAESHGRRPGDEKLLSLLRQLRKHLEQAPADEHARIIKRALRRAGSSIAEPKPNNVHKKRKKS
ncbi:MAG TPA: hypothetical protein VFM02_00200 [Candidatus Paceibacterota bacterium]|nr:hypothetical protein [Candidatus Paceibacterota bacterium]